MVFKRLIITLTALFVGLALGLLSSPVIIARFGLPNTFWGLCLVSIPCALIVAVAVHLIYSKVSSDMDKMAEAEQQQMQRRWAWLKPAGLALRSPFPLNKNQVIIGRDIKCDVMLLDDSISRKHAEIVREGAGWRIRDLDSSNGTFVNGQRVPDALLNEGDLVTLGDINLTFEGPHEPLPEGFSEEMASFSPDPETVVSLDPVTQVHRLNSGTGTRPAAFTGTHTEVLTSSTKRVNR